jgi:hypothetical protein
MVSEQSYMSARKWTLEVNCHLRVAVGHPFLAVRELKDAPRAPVQVARHTPQPGEPLNSFEESGGLNCCLYSGSCEHPGTGR